MEYGFVYYALDYSDVYNGPQIRMMLWYDTNQNHVDAKEGNIYNTYADAFDVMSDL